MSSVVLHCKPAILDEDIINLPHVEVQHNDGEVDLIVDDVPYEIVDGTYQDPDEQLCEFYNINYDLVNCIELY